jgi:hypothetical protein
MVDGELIVLSRYKEADSQVDIYICTRSRDYLSDRDIQQYVVRILSPFSPALTSITPVSKLLIHITHTHPKTKSGAILERRAL